VEAEVDGTGFLQQAELVETYEGVTATEARYLYSRLGTGDFRGIVMGSLQDRFPGATYISHTVEGLQDHDAPVVLRYRLHGGKFGKRVSSMLILEPGRCAGSIVSENLPAPPRKWDLRLERPELEEVEIRIRIPEGWEPEELPGSSELDTPELFVRSSWDMKDGVLAYSRMVRLSVDTIPPDRYPDYREAGFRANREAAQGVVFVRR
jgi:hypothetical protein